MKLRDFNPQYITNDSGEKISVILPISEFQELLEDIEDLATLRKGVMSRQLVMSS